MIKARVNTYLNVRTGKPEIRPDNNPGDIYLVPGEIVQIAEAIEGENYKEIKTWYKLEDGTFVWSGGVELDGRNELILSLKFFWNQTRGDQTIALLDTGVAINHPNLSDKVRSFNIANDGLPTRKHGTRMASLMIGKKDDDVVGFSPDSTIYDFKIFRNDLLNTPQNLLEALSQVEAKDEVKVVNLSLEFQDEEITDLQKNAISEKIKTLVSLGKIVVAATGNNGQYVTFPGSDANVITVGALKNGTAVNFPAGVDVNHSRKEPDCFIELFRWEYCDLTSVKEEFKHDSSEATAAMSALIALKASLNKRLSQVDIKKMVQLCRFPIEEKPALEVYKLNVTKFLNL